MSSGSKHTPFVVLLASAAALGGFLFGFDTAVINGAVIALQKTFAASSLMIGLAVSLALLGSAVGALLAGRIADRIGRVRAMLIAAAAFFISAIGSGLPITIWDFIAWRVLGGMAVGAASVLAPAYIAEISPAFLRGRLGSLQQMAIVTGIFVALLANYLIAASAGSAEAPFWFGWDAWRWMFWMEALPSLVYGGAALFLPESPRYLVAQRREAEATAVLEHVGEHDPSNKVSEIRQTLDLEHKPTLADITGPYGLKAIVWLGVGLSVFQQFVGINVIFYYSSVLWRSVGFSEQNALIITAITGATNILTTILAILMIDRFGRRPLLLAGSVGMTISLGLMALMFATAGLDADGQPVLEGASGVVALVSANTFVFFFGFSWGPVVWVLLGEMFPNRIRAMALAIAASAQWVANFIITTTFPPLAEHVGLGGAYLFYTLSAAASFFLVWLTVPETKGVELEDMGRLQPRPA